MNVSSACPQCGTIANPTYKFCNTCGTPLARPAPQGPVAGPPAAAPPPAGPPPQAGGYGAPPPPQGPQYVQTPYPGSPQAIAAQQQYAQPPQPPRSGGARCQLGHDIAPGASYCAQGHPIALDAMQFSQQPQPPQPQFGAPPQPAQGFGFGGQPYGQPHPPMQPQGYAPPPMQAFGAMPPGQQQPPAGAPSPYFQPAPVPPPGAPQGYGAPPGQSPAAYSEHTAPAPAPGGAKVLRGFLVSFQSNPQGDFWPVHTGRTTVGRANAGEPADIPLADATISSRHAALVVDPERVVVEDTNSTNGTYVNEEPIGQNGKRELRDGDRLRFGGYTTLVKILGRL